MTARTAPYPAPGYSARVPEAIWNGALETIRSYATRGQEPGPPGSEALVYLAGVVAGDEMIVTGLYLLNHAPQGDRVVVTPEESRWLLRTLKARDEKLIAQLHSHRGLAGHSSGDDAWATSFHEGFLSIVVPFFGRDAMTPVECAVLEYRGGRFVELDEGEVRRRIHVCAPIAARGGQAAADERDRSLWSGFVRRLRSIARRPR